MNCLAHFRLFLCFSSSPIFFNAGSAVLSVSHLESTTATQILIKNRRCMLAEPVLFVQEIVSSSMPRLIVHTHIFAIQRSNMNMRLTRSLAILVVVISGGFCDECGQFKFNSNATLPWNVGIYFGNQKEAHLVCLGTVIQANAVLTAAHCFCDNLGGNLRNGSFYLLAGTLPKKVDLKTPPTGFHKISKDCIHIHKYYKGVINFFENDLAIVKDNFSFSNKVKSVCVDWSTEINDNESQLKQPVWRSDKVIIEEQTHLSSDDCHSAPKQFIPFITDDKSCTKLTSTNAGLRLNHESEGAGLFFQSTKWYIKGVISVHEVTKSQFSTFTSVRQYINWISNICAQ